MAIGNNKKSLMLGAVSAIIVCIGLWYLFMNTTPKEKEVKEPPKHYVFTKAPIKKGDIIKEENIQVKEVEIPIQDAYENMSDIIGAKANGDMEADQIIVPALVSLPNQNKYSVIPAVGFRAVALPLSISSVPPFVKPNKRFDLYTTSNSVKIENLKILDIIEQPENGAGPMILFEIKSSDVSDFIEKIKDGEKYVLVEKNIADYGPYRYTSFKPSKIVDSIISDGIIPKVDGIEKLINDGIDEASLEPEIEKKEVEVIIGNQKSVMEFSE